MEDTTKAIGGAVIALFLALFMAVYLAVGISLLVFAFRSDVGIWLSFSLAFGGLAMSYNALYATVTTIYKIGRDSR